jgi:3-oxoacyl-[acyl-carrier protein] reductase
MTKKYNFNNALVLGGSSGLGKAIADELKKSCRIVKSFSSNEIDTSNLESVENFLNHYKSTDILILNSGGPPPLSFNKITTEIWYKYFNQLFLGFCLILKKIKINKNGYIFYISSSIIKEPSENLILSSSLRTGFSSVLKSLSRSYAKKKISVINIAPGPFKTKRVKDLIKNLKKYEKKLPLRKIGDPKEIGLFVKSIVDNKIKYISGSVVYFDGNTLNNFN